MKEKIFSPATYINRIKSPKKYFWRKIRNAMATITIVATAALKSAAVVDLTLPQRLTVILKILIVASASIAATAQLTNTGGENNEPKTDN